MNNVKQILIPIDFSTTSETALEYTSELIKDEERVAVKLLHICSPDTGETDVEQLKEDINELVNKWVDSRHSFSPQVHKGKLIESILQVQGQDDSDLIIMGTSGSDDENMQTNTATLVLEAECPVLVVPENISQFSLKNIALALGHNVIDNSGGFQVLHDIARTFNAKVHVLTINREEADVSVRSENQDVLDYYLESLLYFHAFPSNSDIEIGIMEYVKQHDIDMLAIIPRNHAQKSTPSEGRLTKLLTMHTSVPLLTID